MQAATATETLEVQARLTQDTNYYGLRNVCKTLFPLLVANARSRTLPPNRIHDRLTLLQSSERGEPRGGRCR